MVSKMFLNDFALFIWAEYFLFWCVSLLENTDFRKKVCSPKSYRFYHNFKQKFQSDFFLFKFKFVPHFLTYLYFIIYIMVQDLKKRKYEISPWNTWQFKTRSIVAWISAITFFYSTSVGNISMYFKLDA